MEDRDFIIIAFAVLDTNVVVSSMLGNKRSATPHCHMLHR